MEIQINNNLRDRAYDNACKHGFHDEKFSDEHWLMLIITEIGEAVNADRKGKHADIEEFNKTTKITDFGFMRAFERYIKDSVCDELADVVIRCLDFAGLRKFELTEIGCGSDTSEFTELMFETVKELIAPPKVLVRAYQIKRVVSNIFEASEHLGVDLLWFIEQKMRYNELREPMHNKKY